MNHQLFDKHIKEQLANYNSPVPKGIWEKILQEKKRTPSAIWFNSKPFQVFSLIVTISAFGIFMLYHQNKVETTQINFHKTQNSVIFQDELVGKLNIANNSIIASKKNIQQRKSLELTLAKSHQSIQSTNNGLEKTTTVVNEHMDSNALSINENNEFESKASIEYHASKKFNINSYQPHLSNGAHNFKKKNIQPVLTKQAFIQNKIAPSHTFLIKDPIGCPEDRSDVFNNWYLESYTAPEIGFKKVTGVEGNSMYLSKKDSAESMRGGFTFGVRIAKQLNKNFILKTGVQFSQLNELVKIRRESERKTVIVITDRTITDPLGNLITVSDTSTIVQVIYAESNTKNHYRNIELPITLGYEFGNKKWRAAINGGVIMNIASWYTGKVLDTSYQLVNVQPKENDGITKHNVAFSLYGSISLIKPITNNCDVFAEPYFRYSLSKLQNTAYNFSQRFSAAGIALGIRYKLNK